MEIIHDYRKMQLIADKYRKKGEIIGFVPTMGYLHEGHLSLIKKARTDNDIVFVSIFVNPLQFAPDEDLDRYPRDFKRDESLLEAENVDFLFYPTASEMYPSGFQTFVEVRNITKMLEGKSRPTHFRGVTTVVSKLFNITKPHRAYFGKKDAQQLIVIKRMVEDLNMDIEIIGMPIIREKDGLAMSSRNKYLTEEQRKQAVCLFKALKKAENMINGGVTKAEEIKSAMAKVIESYPLANVDYISINKISDLEELKEIEKNNTLISLAVKIGSTRLIDNMWF